MSTRPIPGKDGGGPGGPTSVPTGPSEASESLPPDQVFEILNNVRRRQVVQDLLQQVEEETVTLWGLSRQVAAGEKRRVGRPSPPVFTQACGYEPSAGRSSHGRTGEQGGRQPRRRLRRGVTTRTTCRARSHRLSARVRSPDREHRPSWCSSDTVDETDGKRTVAKDSRLGGGQT
jgi:hypothetical protein